MAPSPAKSKKTDDLFEKSTMTFGEHLEELRRALAWSFLWLALGMMISLTFAGKIINSIQVPLYASLKRFYNGVSETEWKRVNGTEMPPSIKKFMEDFEYSPAIEYIIPTQMKRIVDEAPKAELDPAALKIESPAKEGGTSKEESKAGATKPGATSSPKTETSSVKLEDAKPTTVANVPVEKDATLTKFVETPIWIPPNLNATDLRPIYTFRKLTIQTEALQVTEPFMIFLKAGLVAGLVLASPGIFWHIWGFISAGMYPHERRYVYFFLPASLFLFLGGAALAFFGVFQIVLDFLLGFNASLGINAAPRLNDYMTFALILPLGFGIAFQLPLVMLILERLGICSVQLYLKQWRWALMIIAFLSMVLTPGDVSVMIAMMVPLIGLYYLGIAMCHFLPRGTRLGEGGYDAS